MTYPMKPRFEGLNSERHRGWMLGPHAGYGYLWRVSSVEVMANECHRVACDLPLVWLATGADTVGLNAVLAPGADWPLARDGRWLGTYLPVLLRTYPFIPGEYREQGVGVYVDINSPMVSPPDEGKGAGWHPWFDGQGAPSPALRAVLEVLRGVHRARQETAALGRALGQLKLLKPIRMPGAPSQAYSADLEAMHLLPPPLGEVFKRRGWLKSLYAQALSLAHLGNEFFLKDDVRGTASES